MGRRLAAALHQLKHVVVRRTAAGMASSGREQQMDRHALLLWQMLAIKQHHLDAVCGEFSGTAAVGPARLRWKMQQRSSSSFHGQFASSAKSGASGQTTSDTDVSTMAFWSSTGPPCGGAMPPPVPRLVASRVGCMRGGEVILREMNLTLHEGDAAVLTGPNGSGKSTMLRLLAGFIKPSAGRVLWDGVDLSQPGMYDIFQPQVHILGSKDAIKARLTVHENVRFWADLEGCPETTDGALHRLGIDRLANLKGGMLSLGQRKRLQLARLVAIPRPFWLLDEPSVGLDQQGAELLEDLIRDHRSRGGIVLVATHTPIKVEDSMSLKFRARERMLKTFLESEFD